MPAKKPKALPKSMGACADLLYDTREERLALAKQVEALEAEERRIKNHIIDNLDKNSSGAMGKHHKVKVVVKPKPQVKDWDKFYAFIAKNKAWELLQRRIGEPAAMERTEFKEIPDPKNKGKTITVVKKTVPGVEIFNAVDVSLTKV